MKKIIALTAVVLGAFNTVNAQGVIDETIQITNVTATTATTGTITFAVAGHQGAGYITAGGLNAANLRYDIVLITSPVGGTVAIANASGTFNSSNSTILTGGVTNASSVPTYGTQGTSPTGTNASLGYAFIRNNSTDPDLPSASSSRAALFTITYPYTISSGYTINTTTTSVVQRTATGNRGSSWSSQTSTTGNAFTQGTASALPLELTDFDASNNGDNRALLQWVTVKEQNTASFEVQRSADGDNFTETVARVRAAGKSSSLLKYQSYDQQPLSGVNYYRLKMIDQDGKYTYSAVRKVTFGGKAPEVVVFPTDNRDGILHVNLTQETAEAQLHLLNAAGQIVAAPVEGLGLNRTMQLSALPAGVYTLQVADGKTSQAFRVSYQH